jgi:hypothetical protein
MVTAQPFKWPLMKQLITNGIVHAFLTTITRFITLQIAEDINIHIKRYEERST